MLATAWLLSGPGIATAQNGSVLQSSSARVDVGEADGSVSLTPESNGAERRIG